MICYGFAMGTSIVLGAVLLLCLTPRGGHRLRAPTPPSDNSGNGEEPSPLPPACPVLSITPILAFGDSLTAGTTSPPLLVQSIGLGLPESYPFKLHAMLASRTSGKQLRCSTNDSRAKRQLRHRRRFQRRSVPRRRSFVLLWTVQMTCWLTGIAR
jgi:hypothetical protein